MNQLQVYHCFETISGLASADREKQKDSSCCEPVGSHKLLFMQLASVARSQLAKDRHSVIHTEKAKQKRTLPQSPVLANDPLRGFVPMDFWLPKKPTDAHSSDRIRSQVKEPRGDR